MIERKFVAQRKKEYQVHEYFNSYLDSVGHSSTKIVKTPLGEKVVISASRPGLIVGRKGANIKQLTKGVKGKFKLENPEVEINEVENIYLDANIVCERIVSSLERFGSKKFKGIGHKIMTEVMNAGAYGIEITISGKIPSSRAKTWRFYSGYLKKCGDIALSGVRTSIKQACLKTGVVGIQVKIMPPETKLPDDISVVTQEELDAKAAEAESKEGEVKETAEEAKEEKAEEKPAAKKKTAKKKTTKKAEEKPAEAEEKAEEPKEESGAKEE